MDDILVQWDQSIDKAQHDRLKINYERRRFLHDSYKATAGLALLPSISLFTACDQTPHITQAQLAHDDPWKTFAAVQLILFPDDGNGPSAVDLNATAYLQFVLQAADSDKQDVAFILKGIDWLNQLSQSNTDKLFIYNNSQQQNSLIKQTSQSSSGERWISFLLLYIFEALLTDPVYGANPNGIGWAWLEHQAGFPHPPSHKIYTQLLKK